MAEIALEIWWQKLNWRFGGGNCVGDLVAKIKLEIWWQELNWRLGGQKDIAGLVVKIKHCLGWVFLPPLIAWQGQWVNYKAAGGGISPRREAAVGPGCPAVPVAAAPSCER